MKLSDISNNSQNIESDSQQFDAGKFILKIANYWKWILFSLLIFLSLAFLHNKTTPAEFQVSGKFFIKEDNANLGILDLTGLSDNGFLPGSGKKVINEAIVLKSKPIAERVLKSMDLTVEYFEPGTFVNKELYSSSPIIVQVDWSYPQVINGNILISWAEGDYYDLSFPDDEYFKYVPGSIQGKILDIETNKLSKEKLKFGEWVELPVGRFKVALIENISNGNILVQFIPKSKLLSKLTGEDFDIMPMDKMSSLLSLTLKTSHPQKGADYLNNLMQVYLDMELEEKNRIAQNTVDFIDSQISGVADSLSLIEGNLQTFRSSNRTYNTGEESNTVFKEITELERELSQEKFKRQYYLNLQSYLVRENYDQIIIPSGIGIEDPILNNLIQNLITLQNERSTLLVTQTEASPRVRDVNKKIQDNTNNLTEVLKNVSNNSQLMVTDLENRISKIEKQFTRLPSTEQNLIKLQREFTLNESIYNFLLQRRAEAAITLASNSSSNKIVEYSEPNFIPIKLKQSIILVASFAIGIFLPVFLIGLFLFIDKRIKDPKELESQLSVPLLANIAKNKSDETLVVFNEPRSSIAETFRALKTNISFVVPKDNQLTIAVSSTLSGEGKTFTAINLASIYSLNNKKSILVSCDMFKPSAYREFKLQKKEGLSNFLSQQIENFSDVIQATNFPLLDIISSGAIPPNPSDLLGSERFVNLIEELKKQYSVVILDTPPVGLISQSYEIIKHVDLILYVMRYNFSEKSFVTELNNIKFKKGVKNIYAVLNDLPEKELTYKGYNYGYYESPKSKKSFLKNLFTRNKAAL